MVRKSQPIPTTVEGRAPTGAGDAQIAREAFPRVSDALLTIGAERPLPPHEEITGRARGIWEERGRPNGQDLDIWLAAQRDLAERKPLD